VTYSGITDAERRNFGLRYNPFKNDEFNTARYGTSLVNSYDVNPNINLTSSVYYNTFSRDWWRQSSRTTDNQCNTAANFGGINYPGSFREDRLEGRKVNVDRCDSIQGRLRDYYIYGLDERATFGYALTDTVANQLKIGFRLHEEHQDRVQRDRGFGTGWTKIKREKPPPSPCSCRTKCNSLRSMEFSV
jgi:Fe(3+) dicitrate transport protein